jgi:hypothetical protein
LGCAASISASWSCATPISGRGFSRRGNSSARSWARSSSTSIGGPSGPRISSCTASAGSAGC